MILDYLNRTHHDAGPEPQNPALYPRRRQGAFIIEEPILAGACISRRSSVNLENELSQPRHTHVMSLLRTAPRSLGGAINVCGEEGNHGYSMSTATFYERTAEMTPMIRRDLISPSDREKADC